jgi:hypothetical protein
MGMLWMRGEAQRTALLLNHFNGCGWLDRLCANDAGAWRAQNDGLHLAATMAAPRHPLRSYIIALFQRGDLVSVHEATLICDASRQAVTKWLKAEGISVEARRLAHLARLRTKGQRQVEGLPPMRRPTKTEMRRDLDKAMRRFNAANAGKAEPG